MRFQAGIQLTLLVVAIIIAVSVVKPKIESIRVEQSEVDSYRTAVENIGLYNQRLQALVNESNAISAYDRAVLWRYLPEEIDATLVARDVANIVTQNRMLLLDVIPSQATPVTEEVSPDVMVAPGVVSIDPNATGVVIEGDASAGILMEQQFQVEVIGTYEQMKSMLRDLERNAYPLRLIEFEFELEDDPSLVQYSLVLETYALPGS